MANVRRNSPWRRQRPTLLTLEDRRVPASIAGAVWKDSLGGGTRAGGEIAYPGVNIALWQDGGNGVFDAGTVDDIFFINTPTDAVGAYSLPGLTAGKYFVDLDTTPAEFTSLKLQGADPLVYDLTAAQDVLDGNFIYKRQSPPPLTIPGGFDAPGAFPIRASGAIMNAAPVPGSTLGGAGSDSLSVTFLASGPYNWTESRHNEGDISLNINPFDPVAAAPPAGFVNNYGPTSGPATYAWRINRETGLSFASVHANGFDNLDKTGGGANVGTMYGVAYFNTDASGGFGYNPVTGIHQSGNNGQDLQLGIMGTPDEATLNTALAHFPFDEGWVGGYVDDVLDAGNATFDSGFGSPGLDPATNVVWDISGFGKATVNLTGFKSDFTPANGLLFVSPNAGNNNTTEIAAALPSGNGWTVALRQDSEAEPTGVVIADFVDSEFQFMYVDTRYKNARAGRVTGATGALALSGGNVSTTRLSTGRYAVSIPGEADLDGTLLLTVSGAQAGDPSLPSRSVVSYQYDSGMGKFIVETRQLVVGGNVFGQDAQLTDTDFSFAWVDFVTPMQPLIAAPSVASVLINNGQAQRSDVTSVQLTFDQIVNLPGTPASAFTLKRNSDNAVVNLAAVVNNTGPGTVVTLTFTGGAVDADSLANGRYTLTALAGAISNANGQLDGNGDGTAGDNYVLASANAPAAPTNIWRLFGDSDGDNDVDTSDFAGLRIAFGGGGSIFDFDGDGDTDTSDFGNFRANFGTSI